jgi:hypothetical protein
MYDQDAHVKLTVHSFQIDNQLPDPVCSVLLWGDAIQVDRPEESIGIFLFVVLIFHFFRFIDKLCVSSC